MPRPKTSSGSRSYFVNAISYQNPLSFTDIAHLDVAFHDSVFQAAHHERLYEAWLSLRSQILLLLARNGEPRKHPAQSWRKDHEDLFEVLVRAKPAEAVRVVHDHIDGTYSRVRELSYETTGNPVPTSTRPSLLALETALVPNRRRPCRPARGRLVWAGRLIGWTGRPANWPVPFAGRAVPVGWRRNPQVVARRGDDLGGAPVADLTSYHR